MFPGASRPVWLGGDTAGLWEKPEHRGEPRPRPGRVCDPAAGVECGSCLVPRSCPLFILFSSLLLAFLHLPPPAPLSPASPHLFLLLSSPDCLPLHSNFAKHFLLLKPDLVRNTVVVFKGGEEGRKSVSSQRDTQATRGSCRPQTLLRKPVAGSGLHGTTRARPSWGHIPSASASLCRMWAQDAWAAGHLPPPAGARPNPRRAPRERVPGSGIQGPSA